MSDDNHKLEELTAYVYGQGTPAERAAFELHLRDCPDCRADVERLQRLLPFAHAELRKPPDTSVDGMMRLMERAGGPRAANPQMPRSALHGRVATLGFRRCDAPSPRRSRWRC